MLKQNTQIVEEYIPEANTIKAEAYKDAYRAWVKAKGAEPSVEILKKKSDEEALRRYGPLYCEYKLKLKETDLERARLGEIIKEVDRCYYYLFMTAKPYRIDIDIVETALGLPQTQKRPIL